MSSEDLQFCQWGVVEVMGHRRFAGFITVESIAGPMIRVDVPRVEDRPAFTKYLSPQSIYAVTPTSEAVARDAARSFKERPLEIFEPAMQRRIDFDDEEYDDP